MSVPPSHSSLTRGLTIVELIVVIGVIGLLMAIAVPSLRSAQANSRMVTERNAARQLMLAYTAYANSNQERVLTGYGPGSANAFDAKGDPISGTLMLNQARQRYPWRLAPYLDYRMEGLFLHNQRDLLEEAKYAKYETYLYAASIVPSFGINARWVGGDFTSSANPRACVERDIDCSQPGNVCCALNSLYGRFWISRLTEARTPEQLIVFASARSEVDPIAQWAKGGITRVEGHHLVQSPRFTTPASKWSDTFSANQPATSLGYVSPRYSGGAVIGFMDGSTGLLGVDDLHDMRYWTDRADHPEWYMKAKTP